MASSSGRALWSARWYLSAMWRIELPTKTTAAETITGIQRLPNGIAAPPSPERRDALRPATTFYRYCPSHSASRNFLNGSTKTPSTFRGRNSPERPALERSDHTHVEEVVFRGDERLALLALPPSGKLVQHQCVLQDLEVLVDGGPRHLRVVGNVREVHYGAVAERSDFQES